MRTVETSRLSSLGEGGDVQLYNKAICISSVVLCVFVSKK